MFKCHTKTHKKWFLLETLPAVMCVELVYKQFTYPQTNTKYTYCNILSIQFWKPACTHQITKN